MDNHNGDGMEMLKTQTVVEPTINGLGGGECEMEDDEPLHLQLPASPVLDTYKEQPESKPVVEKIETKKEIVPLIKPEPVAPEVENVKTEEEENFNFQIKSENIDILPSGTGVDHEDLDIKPLLPEDELHISEIVDDPPVIVLDEVSPEIIAVPENNEEAANIPPASQEKEDGEVNGPSSDGDDDGAHDNVEVLEEEEAREEEDAIEETQPEPEVAIEENQTDAVEVDPLVNTPVQNEMIEEEPSQETSAPPEVEDTPQENGHLSGPEIDSEAPEDNQTEIAEETTEPAPAKTRAVVRKKKKRKGKRVPMRPAKKPAKELSDTESPSDGKVEKKNNVKKSVLVAKNSQKRVGDDMDSINIIKKKLRTCSKAAAGLVDSSSNLNGKNLQAIIEILRNFSYHQLTFEALWELLRMSFCTVAANENPTGKLQRIMKKVLKVSREQNRLFASTREQFVTFTQIIQKMIEERELAKTVPGMVIAPPRTARTVGVQVQVTILPPIPKQRTSTTCTDVIDLDDEGVDENSAARSPSETVTVEPARMEADTDSDSSQPSSAAQKTPSSSSSSITPTLHARLSGNVTIHPVTPNQTKQPTPVTKSGRTIPTQIARKGTTYAHPLANRISNTNMKDLPDKNAAIFKVKKLAANGEVTIKSSRQSLPSTPTQIVSPSPRRASSQEVIDLTDNENVSLTPTISADSVRTISKRMSAAMEASKSSSSVRPKTKLPALPVAPSKYPNGPTPPKPVLSVARSNTGVIVLSWNFPDGVVPEEEITFFQVYSYQESKDASAGPGWNKVGHIKALELPMACKLHQLVTGHRYFFAVRAMDQCQRLGPFSSIESIQVTPLPNRTKT